jgi:hypothetical protein
MAGGELIRNVMTRLSIGDDFWLWDAVFVTRVPITEYIRFLSFLLVTVRQKVKVSLTFWHCTEECHIFKPMRAFSIVVALVYATPTLLPTSYTVTQWQG